MNENYNHFNGVRIRILNGTGTLIPTLYNIDKSANFTPIPINMTVNRAIEPFSLAQLKSQRCIVRLETDNKDDNCEITRIILFYKPLWASTPQ